MHEGRRYHRKKVYVNGDSFYQCYAKSGCPGSLTLDNNNRIKKLKKHDDDCKVDYIKNAELKNKSLERRDFTLEPIRILGYLPP